LNVDLPLKKNGFNLAAFYQTKPKKNEPSSNKKNLIMKIAPTDSSVIIVLIISDQSLKRILVDASFDEKVVVGETETQNKNRPSCRLRNHNSMKDFQIQVS
jgi:hypothetical protein